MHGEGDKTKITSFLIVLFFPAGKTSSLSAVYFIHQAAVKTFKNLPLFLTFKIIRKHLLT